MKEGRGYTVLCLAFAIVIMLVLIAGMFLMPAAMRLYIKITERPEAIIPGVLRTYYFVAPPTVGGLVLLCKLLLNMLNGEVFEVKNAKLLRLICIFAVIASLLCVVLGCRYLPIVICAVAGVFISLILAVLSRLFYAAAKIKAENELTI